MYQSKQSAPGTEKEKEKDKEKLTDSKKKGKPDTNEVYKLVVELFEDGIPPFDQVTVQTKGLITDVHYVKLSQIQTEKGSISLDDFAKVY